jgi:hypothetical protein
MFVIDPRDPSHPHLIGEPAPTLGHIPVSVSYSRELKVGEFLNEKYNGSIATKAL